jgi:hypothetical protein
MRKVITLIWLSLVIVWNYSIPNALPYEDVFVTVVLALLLNYCKNCQAQEKWSARFSPIKGQSGDHY